MISPGLYGSFASITVVWNYIGCTIDLLHYVIVMNSEEGIIYNGTERRFVFTDLSSGCYTIRVYPVTTVNGILMNLTEVLNEMECIQGITTTPPPETTTVLLETTTEQPETTTEQPETTTEPLQETTSGAANGTAIDTGTNKPSNVSPLTLTEIALIAVGGVAFISLLCICCTIVVCVRRRRRKKVKNKKARRMSRVEDM